MRHFCAKSQHLDTQGWCKQKAKHPEDKQITPHFQPKTINLMGAECTFCN